MGRTDNDDEEADEDGSATVDNTVGIGEGKVMGIVRLSIRPGLFCGFGWSWRREG